jgi:hypothetical protein
MDTFDITTHAMQFPYPYKKWGFQVSAGLSMVKPPEDLQESATQAPLAKMTELKFRGLMRSSHASLQAIGKGYPGGKSGGT